MDSGPWVKRHCGKHIIRLVKRWIRQDCRINRVMITNKSCATRCSNYTSRLYAELSTAVKTKAHGSFDFSVEGRKTQRGDTKNRLSVWRLAMTTLGKHQVVKSNDAYSIPSRRYTPEVSKGIHQVSLRASTILMSVCRSCYSKPLVCVGKNRLNLSLIKRTRVMPLNCRHRGPKAASSGSCPSPPHGSENV